MNAGIKGLDLHISIDPTQTGLIQGYNECENNLEKIAFEIKKSGFKRNIQKNDYLMIDMEDSSVTEDTIKLYSSLVKKKLPAGITLQAYLFRTAGDLERIIQKNGRVRLVKGAFAEKKDIAYTRKKDIDQKYINFAKMMLGKKNIENGFYPVFATHDHNIIEQIIKIAKQNKVNNEMFEFEMLYGVRKNLQKQITARGFRLRLYLPFGKDWWPYTIRRIGENPKNVKFIMSSLF